MLNGTSVLHFKDFSNSYIPNIMKEIWLDRIYTPYLPYMQDKVVLDCGANLGLFSLYAADYAKFIYAFEPASDTNKLLEMNLRENKVLNVGYYKKAIAPENGKATFHINTNTTMNSLNPLVNDHGATEEVETVRIDDFLKEHGIERIGMIKCDIEGEEHRFFASESFANIAPLIDCMIYEFHSWTNVSPNNINEGLKELGFTNIKQVPCDATVFACTK